MPYLQPRSHSSARKSRALGQPGAGYFALAELQSLNSGYYHDSCHALEVAELAFEVALAFGLTPARAEFLKQVALVHDADPRVCSQTGEVQEGTPARVQVTLAWMESEREKLEARFGWEGYQFEEACALIARTDYPFDRTPKCCGTRFDGRSPFEVYRETLGRLPRELREACLRDGLLLRFADQAAAYVKGFARARQSVLDLVDELKNAGVSIQLADSLKKTPEFLNQIGKDLDYDRMLTEELGLPEAHLPTRREILAALGWNKRLKMKWNSLRFRWA